MKNETIITKQKTTNIDPTTGEYIKKRVCVYARVSTKKEIQSTSFKLQIATYFNQIMTNPLWQFAGVFADFGKSGTSTKRRNEFNKMIELCRLGEIDIILIKSVSRFARNTIDALTVVQELRLLNVEIRFENENISTLDSNFDFYLSTAISIAQEESRSTSQNMIWTYQKKFQEGLCNTISHIYGYNIDDEKNFIINADQAETIRFIFNEYVNGTSVNKIIDKLELRNIKTATGKNRFSKAAVRNILTNEKYCGDLMLQKEVTKDVGNRSRVPNNNMKTKYYIENNHPPIISRQTFDKAQQIRNDRLSQYRHICSGEKTIRTDYAGYVYSISAKKYYRYKVSCKNTKWELKMFELFKNDNGAGIPPIHFRQIDEIKNEIISKLASDVKGFVSLVTKELEDRIKCSGIDNKLNTFENKALEVAAKIQQIGLMDIDYDAKQSVKKKLDAELIRINEQLCELRYLKVMRYEYGKNLTLLGKKLKRIKLLKNNTYGYKDIINCVIALDRENLLFCLHLSNRDLNKIDLENEILNTAIMEGTTPYIQSRLSLKTNWKLIII